MRSAGCTECDYSALAACSAILGYAPLSRAHCCFFCWTSDAGLLTDSIALQTLHFLMLRIARFVYADHNAVTVRRLMSTHSGEPSQRMPAQHHRRASRLASCVHSLSATAGPEEIPRPTISYFKLTACVDYL